MFSSFFINLISPLLIRLKVSLSIIQIDTILFSLLIHSMRAFSLTLFSNAIIVVGILKSSIGGRLGLLANYSVFSFSLASEICFKSFFLSVVLISAVKYTDSHGIIEIFLSRNILGNILLS